MCMILICLYIVAVWCLQISLYIFHIALCVNMHYLCDQLHFAFSRWLYLLQYGLYEIFANAIYTPGICTLCILWDCCTNCNQLGSVWSQSLLLKHCQHVAYSFQSNVLTMFRMQYFCNNVIFATPICNTFLSNKDIWSRICFEISFVQVLTSQGMCATLPFFFNISQGLNISESFLHWKISGNVKMIDSMFITSLNLGGKWGTSVLLLLNVLRF